MVGVAGAGKCASVQSSPLAAGWTWGGRARAGSRPPARHAGPETKRKRKGSRDVQAEEDRGAVSGVAARATSRRRSASPGRAAAERRAGDRRRQLPRRPLRRLDHGRVRRRGAQGRASDRRRSDAPLRHPDQAPRRHPGVALRGPQQEVGDHRPAPETGCGSVRPAGRQVRRADRELPPGHHGGMGPRLVGAAGGQSRPGDAARLGLRPDRPLPAAAGLCAYRPRHRRAVLPRRVSGGNAGGAGHRAARRLHLQPVRRDRGACWRCATRKRPAAARSSTSASTSRCSG